MKGKQYPISLSRRSHDRCRFVGFHVCVPVGLWAESCRSDRIDCWETWWRVETRAKEEAISLGREMCSSRCFKWAYDLSDKRERFLWSTESNQITFTHLGNGWFALRDCVAENLKRHKAERRVVGCWLIWSREEINISLPRLSRSRCVHICFPPLPRCCSETSNVFNKLWT